ncbi:MAG: carbon storage regulator [Erysipelotrichaceae bacterium]
MLVLSRKLKQAILIDETIEVTVQEINRDHVKLAIKAPKEVKILRKELVDETIVFNQAALPQLEQADLKSYFLAGWNGKQDD